MIDVRITEPQTWTLKGEIVAMPLKEEILDVANG